MYLNRFLALINQPSYNICAFVMLGALRRCTRCHFPAFSFRMGIVMPNDIILIFAVDKNAQNDTICALRRILKWVVYPRM